VGSFVYFVLFLVRWVKGLAHSSAPVFYHLWILTAVSSVSLKVKVTRGPS
jgi:hypothetical protein